jgi:cysteine desulfurase
MSSMPIYLDYAATTPLDARVVARMQAWLGEGAQYGNAASAHAYGQRASAAVETARAQVAALIGATGREMVWTSGATEANNLALLGVARGAASRRAARRHLVTARTEHKSVLDPCRQLEREGFVVSYLEPDTAGLISCDTLSAALRPDTLLVSIMHANNETGVVQDIAALGALCAERGVALHVDAAQSAGKLPVDVGTLPVDLLSLSAHKLYGPQGIGALYVRTAQRAALQPLLFGGGHERGLRSGTLPVHQLVGFGAAAELAATMLSEESTRIRALREHLYAGIATLPELLLNGHATQRLPGILNVSFPGVQGESLLAGLKELAISASAACNSDSDEPSYVLRSLGRDPEAAQAALRFSIGRFTTEMDIGTAIAAVQREVVRLRALAPEPGSEGASAPGTRLRFELAVQDGLIQSASHRSYGCPHTLAVADWLAARLPGRAVAKVGLGGPLQWAEALSVPADRLGRLLIVEDALNAALNAPASAKNPAAARV